MDYYKKDIEKYRSRLFGLIEEDKILCTEIPRPPKRVIETFKKYSGLTPTISDILDSMGIRGAIAANELKPIQQGVTVVGPVITLKYILEKYTATEGIYAKERGHMADRDAYAVSQPGDIVVYDVGGTMASAQGGMSANIAVKFGVQATICDGCIRDIEEMRSLHYPVWSRGITPVSGKHRIRAEAINGPVMIAGIQVLPGDLCVADDSGICFIPCDKIEIVLEKLIETVEREERVIEALNSGKSISELLEILPAAKW